MGEAGWRRAVTERYEPVDGALRSLFQEPPDRAPLRALLLEAAPEVWRERLKLPAWLYFELLWQTGRVCGTEADELDWSGRLSAAINSGVFDELFGDVENGLGDDRVRSEVFDLVRHGNMPIRCKSHASELQRAVDRFGPCRGLIWSSVIRGPTHMFCDAFGVVDDGDFGHVGSLN